MIQFTEKQREILELAKDMFAEKGYVETSMRDMASVKKIKAASLYSHFKSKEEILECIFDEVYGGMTKIINQVKDEKLDAEDRFNLYVKLHIEYALLRGKSSLIYQKYWNLSIKNHSKYAILNQEYFEMVRNLVRERFPNEVEKECFVPNATTFFLIDTLNNVPKIMNLKKMNLDCVVEDILYRLINGFKKDL